MEGDCIYHFVLLPEAAFVLYERAAVFAFLLVYLYNGKRGRQFKYLFYGIYPLHLLVFGLLRFWLNGNL